MKGKEKWKKTKRLRRHHFSIGRPFPGPIEFCAVVQAYSREEAEVILRDALSLVQGDIREPWKKAGVAPEKAPQPSPDRSQESG